MEMEGQRNSNKTSSFIDKNESGPRVHEVFFFIEHWKLEVRLKLAET